MYTPLSGLRARSRRTAKVALRNDLVGGRWRTVQGFCRTLTALEGSTTVRTMAKRVRQAAAAVMYRATATGHTEVYLVQRSPELAYFGGFWAFPGGSLEPEDGALAPHSTGEGVGPAAQLPWIQAAARELFEETGVLTLSGPQTLSDAAHEALRQQALADSTAFRATCAQLQLQLTPAHFAACGRWRTPPFSPVTFDAQYFAVALPAGQRPMLWPGELSEGVWLTPAEALARHEQGAMLLAYPVCATLRILAAEASQAVDVRRGAQAAQRASAAGLQHTGEMAPGVRLLPLRTPTLPPATHTNAYILGTTELAVVDPGTPYAEDQAELFAVLDALCAAGARVGAVWLTHAHPDHVGGVAAIQKRYAAPLYGHADIQPDLTAGVGLTLDRTLDDNAVLRLEGGWAWQVLHTPGHAPGHLCFYQAQHRHLLAGDNVLGLGSSLVAPAPHGSMQAYTASLQRMLQLDVRLLLPGHGPPVATAHRHMAQTLAHRLERETQIAAALRVEPQSADALVAQVYAQLAAAAQPWARLSLVAHLEKLIAEGRAAEGPEGYVRA